MPHYIIKGTENLQGENSMLVGWFLLLGGEKCSFRSKSWSPKGRGEVKENLYLGGKLCDSNHFTTATKLLVNLLTSEFHFPPVFSSLLQMITLQSWKEGSKTDSTTKQREKFSYIPGLQKFSYVPK